MFSQFVFLNILHVLLYNNQSYNFFVSLLVLNRLWIFWVLRWCNANMTINKKQTHFTSRLLKALPSIYPSSSLNNTHVICILYTYIHAGACTHTKTHLGFWYIFLPFSTICNGIPHEFRVLNSWRSVIDCKKHNKTKTKKKQ